MANRSRRHYLGRAGLLLVAAAVSGIAMMQLRGGRPCWRLPSLLFAARRLGELLRGGGWALVLTAALAIYLSANLLLSGRLSGEANLYLAQPAMWSALAALSLALLRTVREAPRPTIALMGLAVLATIFHLSWQVLAGIFFGFGYSPYAREPLHMAQNLLYVGTMVLGVECSRAYLVAVFYRWQPSLTLAGVSLLFALLLIPVGAYSLFDSAETGFQAAGETFLPGIAQSLMATYLVALGGPLLGVIYQGGLRALLWFSPILPDVEWSVAAFIGTLAPVSALLIVREMVGGGEEEEPAAKGDLSPAWALAAMVVVGILWLNTGMLGVQPAIVSGVSMEPTMRAGDLVLTRDVDPDSLQVGDIVRYDKEGTSILHRIIEIAETPQGRVFVTQGDNNNTADSPIVEAQVEGKVVLVVPKLGWLPIFAKRLLSWVL